MKERDIQRLVLDWLAAKKIWHIRLNTGAMSGSHKGKRWFVKFGKPGMADVLAIDKKKLWPAVSDTNKPDIFQIVYWIEVKAPKGKLSEAQEAFREEVAQQGMRYVVVRSLEDLQKAMEV